MKKMLFGFALILGVLVTIFTLDFTNLEGISHIKEKLCKCK